METVMMVTSKMVKNLDMEFFVKENTWLVWQVFILVNGWQTNVVDMVSLMMCSEVCKRKNFPLSVYLLCLHLLYLIKDRKYINYGR